MSSSIVANVGIGVFYFRDAPFYHYAFKKTRLLEDIKSYNFEFGAQVAQVFNTSIVGANSVEIQIGYGSDYGKEYGGVYDITPAGVNLKLDESDTVGSAGTDSLSLLKFDSNNKVWEPERDLISIGVAPDELEISFTSVDATPNCFGLNPTHVVGKEYLVEVYQQSPYDTLGVLQTPVVGEAYSLSTTRNSQLVTLSDVQTAQGSANPITLPLTNPTNGPDFLLDFLRQADVGWLEYDIKVFDIRKTVDLPSPSTAPFLHVYNITDPSDANFGKYYTRQQDNTFLQLSYIPRSYKSKFQVQLEEDPGNPGFIVQGNNIFVKPVNDFDNANFFDVSRENELAQALMNTFDGIPPGVRFYTNRVQLVVDNLIDDKLQLQTPTFDDTKEINIIAGTEFYLDNILFNSSPKVKLIDNFGIDFIEDQKIFMYQMTRKYTLPDSPIQSAPIVITDLLNAEIDPNESSNVEFKMDGKNIIFNRADNLVSNPTFLKSGNGGDPVFAWKVNNVVYVKDPQRISALLHDKSVNLNNNATSYIRQHIPGINPDNNYALSFFAQSVDSTIGVKIYGFDNGGVPFETLPNVGSAIQTLTFDSISSPVLFSKVVARLIINLDFNPTDHPFFTIGGDDYAQLDPAVTDIIIEINKPSGPEDLYIDAVQFEVGPNPTPFTSLFDYAIVEYEGSSKDYAPRFSVASVDNAINNGFMVIDIDKRDLKETGTPEDVLSKSTRVDLVNKYSGKPWAKLKGTNKYRQVGIFSRGRSPNHLGEYFLLPRVPKATSISFLGAPYIKAQSILYKSTTEKAFFVVVEDESFSNLPNKRVEFSWGLTSGDHFDSQVLHTGDDGTAIFDSPEIYSEQISPSILSGVEGSAPIAPQFTFGYPVIIGVNITVDLSRVPQEDEHFCLFNSKGEYSKLFKADAVSGQDITAYTELTTEDDYGGGVDTPSAPFTHILFTVDDAVTPLGFFIWPEEALYDLDVFNNASALMFYQDGITNTEKAVPIYSRDPSRTLIINASSVAGGIFDMNSQIFNPIIATIKVTDVANPEVIYRQMFTSDLKNNSFYFSYKDRTITVSDPKVKNIQVEFQFHRAFVEPANLKQLFFHRSVLFDMLKNIYNSINGSELQNQHLKTYPAPLSGSVEALSSLSTPLYLRAYNNINIYINAQHGSLTTDSTITYRHQRPLI